MPRTIAEMFIQQGRNEARKQVETQVRREVLLNLLRARFGDLRPKTVKVVKTCKSNRKLNAWLLSTVSAATLDEMGIA